MSRKACVGTGYFFADKFGQQHKGMEMQFKSNWLSGVSIALSTMFLLNACSEKVDYSGKETKKPAKTEEENPKQNDIDAKGKTKPADDSTGEDKKENREKTEPEEDANTDNDQEGPEADLFGKWEMKDANGKILATVTYTSSTLSRKFATAKQYDFKFTSIEYKDGLVYTVHVEPVLNIDTSRYCIYNIVKEPSATYMMVNCENGKYPKIDWKQFTAENRYYKVD